MTSAAPIIQAQSGDSSKIHWPKLILFGDSHFQHGFGKGSCIAALLADQLQRKVDVVVRGFAGYNTRFAKIILDRVFSEFSNDDIAGVLVLFGSNDAAIHTEDPLCQHISLKEFSQNIKDIVESLIEKGIAKEKIVLISPPPVDVQAWNDFCIAEHKILNPRDNVQSARYSQEMEEVAESHGTKFADLHHHMRSSHTWQEYFSDGLHLNLKGSNLFLETLQPVIDGLCKDYPVIFPDWKQVDHANPAASFSCLH